ncbi:Spore coat protein A [Phycisphaerales bacterium]|nr:Spore coat protein A [Phycisphaerales bacterium]
MRVTLQTFAAIFAAGLAAGAASADVVVLQAAADTSIYEESGALSNGMGDSLFAGKNMGNFARRALVRFDLSGIPAGSTVTDATLTLHLSRTSSDEFHVHAHRLTSSWGEGASIGDGNGGGGGPAQTDDATWMFNHYFSSMWTTQGGDFVALPSAMAIVGFNFGPYTWNDPSLTADVQAWVNSPALNQGWILLGDETTSPTSKRFNSRQHPDEAKRPTLTVTFTPPSGSTGACCVSGTGCIITTSADCTTQGGTFQGSGTTCSPDPCSPPTGACCLSTGYCSITTAADCATQGGTYNGDGTDCGMISCPIPLTPFVDALPVPPVMQPTTGVPGGAAHYDITMSEFEQQLHRDLPPTRVWGYNGTFPARTIEAHTGQPVTVTWTNDLRDLATGQLRTTHYLPVDTCIHGPDQNGSVPVTSVHLHGGHVPADFDGQPDLAFPPGQQSPIFTYPNSQQAATLWYHDHGLGITRLNVYMGLAGFYLLRDANEDALNIPRGEFEVPIVIQDRSFNPDGSLRYPEMYMEHFFGDFAVVNGKVWPYQIVKRGKYRFRLLNGSNSRVYNLALSNGATFWQIASDQGLLTAPVEMSSLIIAPGERADVVIDFASYSGGTQIILTNSAPAPFPAGGVGPDLPEIMKFIVLNVAGDQDPLPAALNTIAPIPESEAVQMREFHLQKTMDHNNCGHGNIWTINAGMWDDVTEFPVLGTTEVWSWINRSGMTHPMHMHLVQFQILDRQPFTVQDGQVIPTGPRVAPPPNEAGWKDTVQAKPWQISRVIARFEDYPGRFAYHCHILEHEDNEMMRQFEVCDPAEFNVHPDNELACAGATASLYAHANGSNLTYVWQHDGQPLSDGPTGSGSIISGSTAYTLEIQNAGAADAGQYDCVATNGCSQAVSNAATLTVEVCCDPDVNCDGAINGFDIEATEAAINGDFSNFCQASADLNGDGAENGFDIEVEEQRVNGAPC